MTLRWRHPTHRDCRVSVADMTLTIDGEGYAVEEASAAAHAKLSKQPLWKLASVKAPAAVPVLTPEPGASTEGVPGIPLAELAEKGQPFDGPTPLLSPDDAGRIAAATIEPIAPPPTAAPVPTPAKAGPKEKRKWQ